jgi:hypothetical protein
MTNGITGADRPFDNHHSFRRISCFGVSSNAAKDEVQCVGLPPEFTRVRFQFGFGNRNHSQKEFCFPCLFTTSPNPVFKIRLGNSIVCFAIICADTRSGTNNLVNQPVVDRIPWNLFCKENHGFAEAGRPLLQIINSCRRFIPQHKGISRRRKIPKCQFVRHTTLLCVCNSIRHSLFVIFSRYAKYLPLHN